MIATIQSAYFFLYKGLLIINLYFHSFHLILITISYHKIFVNAGNFINVNPYPNFGFYFSHLPVSIEKSIYSTSYRCIPRRVQRYFRKAY